jgi:hypothetical protein
MHWRLEDVTNFNTPGITQSGPFINTNSCAKILYHALAIFKMMLVVKSKWSSKLNNLLKMPFLFQNTKLVCVTLQIHLGSRMVMVIAFLHLLHCSCNRYCRLINVSWNSDFFLML